MVSRRIYASDHHRSREALDLVVKQLQAVFRSTESQGREAELRLFATNGVLLSDGIPLGSPTQRSEIADLLREKNHGGIVISRGVDAGELGSLFDWLSDRRAETPEGLVSIRLLDSDAAERGGLGEEVRSSALERVPDFKLSVRIHRAASKLLSKIMDDARAGRDLDFKGAREIAQRAASAAFVDDTGLVAPTQVIQADPYTFNHSVNVFLISTTLLQPFASSEEELARWAQAALLHDVGKSLVPKEVLYKKGSLTDEEFAIIQCHPEWGAEILQEQGGADAVAIHVAYCHHMRDGGLGYPKTEMPIDPGPVSNAVQVADVFEAITSERPYHKGLSVAETVDIIMGTPGMESKRPAVGILLDRLSNAPPGSEVILSSGEHALVIHGNPDAPKKPIVQLLTDDAGRPLTDLVRVDLNEGDGGDDERQIDNVILKPATRRAEALSAKN
ncbi:MAG: HD domain-containing phosphohydrolase [Planctomycetota bacterium]